MQKCKSFQIRRDLSYRFGDGTTAVLHIEIANLVVSEKESLETNYMGVINYISNKIPDELREEIFLHGVIENCCEGQYQTIYFNCDKVKYNDELHIEWVANFRDNRDNDFLMCERYCNDDSTLDITVWYGNNSRKIENTEEKKCSLA